MISIQEALGLVKFTRDEERLLNKLETTIDAVFYSRFDGGPLAITLHEDMPPKIIAAVKRKYEEGGWRVEFRAEKRTLFFMPIFFGGVKVQPPKLPPVVPLQSNVAAVAGELRLLVRMPTRGRPRQALEALSRYRTMAGRAIQMEVVIDNDDETMLASPVLQRLNALGCVITVGAHKSKVEAVNAGRVSEWDILVLASDDMMPIVDGYAKRIADEMQKHWPYLDGALHFDDGYQHDKCYTLPILGRRLYAQLGSRIYHPEYKSLWCDVEQTDVLRAMRRLHYVDECIIEHRHHAAFKAPKDALYVRNDALWDRDEAVYKRHARCVGHNLDADLSICICTIPTRKAQLSALLDHVWAQILARDDVHASAAFADWHPNAARVEILVDGGEGTIGEKRQRLIEKARGRFVAFIDDDDWVAHDYVSRVVHAIVGTPDADCVELRGVLTTSGDTPEPTHHSIVYRDWEKRGGVYCRAPNHLNPIRRELALAVGFPSKNHAEDFDYSIKLRPLLKVEAKTGDKPLYFYWFDPTKQVEAMTQWATANSEKKK